MKDDDTKLAAVDRRAEAELLMLQGRAPERIVEAARAARRGGAILHFGTYGKQVYVYLRGVPVEFGKSLEDAGFEEYPETVPVSDDGCLLSWRWMGPEPSPESGDASGER